MWIAYLLRKKVKVGSPRQPLQLKEALLFGERIKVPETEHYTRWLAKFAWSEAWGRAVANPIPAVLISIIAATLTIFIQRHLGWLSHDQMRDAIISLLLGTASVALLLFAVFLVHFFYLSPKHLYSGAKEQIDSLNSQLDSSRNIRLKRREETRENMFQRCMIMLKGPTPLLPFNVVARHEAYNLEENEDVNWLCDEIGKTRYGHPFTGLDPYVPENDRKEFLRWIRFITDYDTNNGNDYLDAAEQWRYEHGYPLPPIEHRIAEVFTPPSQADDGGLD